jgi:uncharacterized membrane protein (DUF2068 family)
MQNENTRNQGLAISTVRVAPKATLGLRSVALFELTKGVLFTIIALGAASLIHHDTGQAASDLVHALHLDPAWHWTRLFIEQASQLTDTRKRLVAMFATALALIRYAESYGLWRGWAWAKWFAVISAAIYLPWEIYRYYRDPKFAGAVIFLINLAIVVYLARMLAASYRAKVARRQGALA